MKAGSYKALALTVGIHFFIMYALVYASVNSLNDTYVFSTRNLYMAFVMVAPMVILMLFFMRDMYEHTRLNLILYTGAVVVFIVFFVFIRYQTLVGNKQFLQSMIPHHSSAITMCEEAKITDTEIQSLCEEIIENQQREIRQMKDILQRI